MPNKEPLDDHSMNELLRQFYLQEKSQVPDAHAAEFVFGQEYKTQPDARKEKQLIEQLIKESEPGTPGNFSFYFSMLAIAALVSVTLFFSFGGKQNNKHFANSRQVEKSSFHPSKPSAAVQLFPSPGYPHTLVIPPSDSAVYTRPVPFSLNDSVAENATDALVSMGSSGHPDIPVLGEKDKIRFRKIKEMILLALYKNDKRLYTHVEGDKMQYRDSTLIMGPFSIRNCGITNLEYKAFLADLLMQERREDYLRARVQARNWESYRCSKLAAVYFQDERYNDFPVVNITREGAELFCRWLEEEIKTYMQQKNLKAKSLQVRLPYDAEWIYAAWTGYARIPFGSGYNTIYDREEGFVNKSFARRMEQVKKYARRKDTLYDFLFVNMYKKSEREITELLQTGFSSYSTLPADTIYPERMRLFGKIDHVSEMVIEKKSGKLWLSGVCWPRKEDYLELLGEFRAASSSPFAGFRCVVINAGDSEYKYPFW